MRSSLSAPNFRTLHKGHPSLTLTTPLSMGNDTTDYSTPPGEEDHLINGEDRDHLLNGEDPDLHNGGGLIMVSNTVFVPVLLASGPGHW